MLVEGNVERLLLPQMIANAAPRLQSTYLTVLEIGGAFGYRFKALIEFLGLTALIVTDLDSVFPAPLPAVDEGKPARTARSWRPRRAQAVCPSKPKMRKTRKTMRASRVPAVSRNPVRRASRAIQAPQRPTRR